MWGLNLFKISAILGLICIIIGISLVKQSQKRKQYLLFIFGGILLEIYSLYIKDMIFIILQIAFIISAIFEFSMLYSRARKAKKTIKQYLLALEKQVINLAKK